MDFRGVFRELNVAKSSIPPVWGAQRNVEKEILYMLEPESRFWTSHVRTGRFSGPATSTQTTTDGGSDHSMSGTQLGETREEFQTRVELDRRMNSEFPGYEHIKPTMCNAIFSTRKLGGKNPQPT